MTTLRNHDVADMAQQAAEEIERLRAQINRLAPLAEAYEAIRTILGLLPGQAIGYGEDLAHRLRRQAEELRAQPVAKIEE
ncbi:hypothetical protein [Novosphingobium sp. BL-52-GroH]|uniref:hypothetical protein n=1 Tax=Novosphingobium sp. BL-52-GroH TaxID=3349877 RepID=UPI00384BF1EA